MRERRRQGIVAVAPLEIRKSDLIPFVKSGLPEEAARALDRTAIGKVVRQLLDGWTQEWYRRQNALKANKPITREAPAQKSSAPPGRT